MPGDVKVDGVVACCARPLGGDGSAWCTLPACHPGMHCDKSGANGAGEFWFMSIEPGTSARAKRMRAAAKRSRARRRIAASKAEVPRD